MTVYTVGLIYNSEWHGEVFEQYSCWSSYEKAKEEALKKQVEFGTAIVVQPFAVDNPNAFFELKIIKQHDRFFRHGT